MLNLVEGLHLKDYCTMRVGGYAREACFPDSTEDFCRAVKECKAGNLKFTVVGNCSNIIFPDEGYDGRVIFTSRMKGVEAKNTQITAMCGEKLTNVSKVATECALSGLEFAYGIPGTVGGGVYMNAGAYGGEIKDCLSTVKVLDEYGEVSILPAESLELGYRTSIFMKEELYVLEASFDLCRGDRDEIKATTEENMRKRAEKQPLEYPSCGSAFKRPEGHFAGALIEQCGLKGFQIGGAAVSVKHAGFIINTGNATAKDVLDLAEHIKETVLRETGVELHPEIRIVK